MFAFIGIVVCVVTVAAGRRGSWELPVLVLMGVRGGGKSNIISATVILASASASVADVDVICGRTVVTLSVSAWSRRTWR